MGYAEPISMAGGFQLWKSEGRAWTQPVVLTLEQKHRYSRHLLIPEVGAEGQAKLLDSKALFIGAGGLGRRPALPRRGGRRHDRHRRLRHRRPEQPPAPGHPHDRPGRAEEDGLGARRPIHALNPDIEVVAPRGDADRGRTSTGSSPGYDVILDGTDTFETRYTLNDAAVAAGIPVVHACVFRFEGQLTVFMPYEGRATAASTPRRRRRSSRPAAPWPACSASCPGPSACSRPPRRSRCCSASATRSSAGC